MTNNPDDMRAATAGAVHSEGAVLYTPEHPARLAVYDFDGTSITGNSPVMLVRYLVFRRKLKFNVWIRVCFWAFAYKFRLPQNESWVRSLVFRAFLGKPKPEVDAYLARFYEEEVSWRFRPLADQSMCRDTEEGRIVAVVSASWEAIIERARQDHSFQLIAATSMCIDDAGNYTCKVNGLPVEGEQKVRSVVALADDSFGQGNWVLERAYGDHHSDMPLLEAAEHAFVVTPDKPLLREAQKRGWRVLDWSYKPHRPR